MTWGKGTSSVLAAAQLAALGPFLKPRTQLRYRIGSIQPRQPAGAETGVPPARVPAMLWPAWSLPLGIPKCHQSQLRPALSVALLLVNTRRSVEDMIVELDSPTDSAAISRAMKYAGERDDWPNVRSGLIRMADYVSSHEVPIDYQRRRSLDYSKLLPDHEWARICRITATPGPGPIRASIARCFVYARVSGNAADRAPSAIDENSFRTLVADFPRYLTPELSESLDLHAREFLADRGVHGEPTTWAPPASESEGFEMPGCQPAEVDIRALHQAHVALGRRLGAVAEAVGTNLDTVRYLLELFPPPRPKALSESIAARRGFAYPRAAAVLNRGGFRELYEQDGLSLAEIAARVGVGRDTITCLARDYEIQLRDPVHRRRVTVDRDWLYGQYVIERRALPDIAKEVGASTTSLARLAKIYAIPMRGRGGHSHSATLATQNVIADAPEVLSEVVSVAYTCR
jgi:hypothetical protein